jgi:hypothetical protein
MASTGKASWRRLIFIVSSVLYFEGSLAVTLSFVEHPLWLHEGNALDAASANDE